MRAGELIHRASIQKRDHAVSAAWSDWSTEPVACRIQQDGEDGRFRFYRVEVRWTLLYAEMLRGILDLGYAYQLLWTDIAGVARELQVTAVDLPQARQWSEPVVLTCREVLQNA